MTTSSMIGSSIKRREDPRLITGNATYVDDVRPPGVLHLAIVRSPHAHATNRENRRHRGSQHARCKWLRSPAQTYRNNSVPFPPAGSCRI